MSRDPKAELKRLKKEYLETERIHQEERESLLQVINAFGIVVAMHEEMAPELAILKKMVDTDETLPRDLINVELAKLKDKIIAKEAEDPSDSAYMEQMRELEERLLESCRAVRKIITAVLDDFYPLTDELAEKAAEIDFNFKDGVDQAEVKHVTTAFLDLLHGLKKRISLDFRHINRSFIHLLEQVKDLEKALSSEFGEEKNLKEIEYFEMKVSSEVGSIIDSFNIHRTIDEIKSTVVEKIGNIRRLVSEKKDETARRAKLAQKNIHKLKTRIFEAEKGMLLMTRKARQFQAAAEKDGLTGLYNRKSFDEKILDSLQVSREHGILLCVILFDVDRFKEINDTLGHVAGDKVLQKVAQCLVQSFRKDDFIARYGGDEFVIILERLSNEMARSKILGFRKNLRRIRFTSYAKGDIYITVSAGIALAKENDTPETLVERADKMMYAHKQKSAESAQ